MLECSGFRKSEPTSTCRRNQFTNLSAISTFCNILYSQLQTKRVSFEFLVMHLASPMHHLALSLWWTRCFIYLGKFVVVYRNDVVVHSPMMEEYQVHLKFVLEQLRANQLYVKRKKCLFTARNHKLLQTCNRVWKVEWKMERSKPYETGRCQLQWQNYIFSSD